MPEIRRMWDGKMEKDPEESEANVYSENVREEYVDSDEITPEEEAFMRGYDEADEEEEEEGKKEKEEKEEKEEENE